VSEETFLLGGLYVPRVKSELQPARAPSMTTASLCQASQSPARSVICKHVAPCWLQRRHQGT